MCLKAVVEQPVWDAQGNLDRRRSGTILNSVDCGALAKALELKRGPQDELVVLSMGTEPVRPVLEELNALDVDRVFLLSDQKFARSDSLATARILAEAAGKLGPFDIILTGRSSSDGETGHVGAQMAVLLGLPCVTNAVSLSAEEDQTFARCSRLLEDSIRTLKVYLPAVFTMCSGHTLPPPSLKGMQKAKGKKVQVLDSVWLGLKAEAIGEQGSETRVVRTYPVRQPRSRCVCYDSCTKGAEQVLALLRRKTWPAQGWHKGREKDLCADKMALVVSLENDSAAKSAVLELAGRAAELYQDVRVVRVGGSYTDDRAAARAVCEEVKRLRPTCVLVPATIRGRCVAPMCAAMMGIGLTADCTQLTFQDGQLVMIRPTFGGALMAQITSRSLPCMATVRPGVFDGEGSITNFLSLKTEDTGAICEISQQRFSSQGNLGQTKIIFSGGRGMGGEEGFACLEKLARRFGAAVCASRPAVDYGWRPYPFQVGQTGIAVKPDVYVACGISGAVQHMAGVRGKTLVAVNPDRKAPIFNYADIGIVDDWSNFVGEMTALLDQEERKHEL